MKLCTRVVLIVIVLGMQGFAYTLADYNPCVRSVGAEHAYSKALPFTQGRGPGNQIGTTWSDLQAMGSFGQRIDVDDSEQAHIVWWWGTSGQSYIAWCLRWSTGGYTYPIQAASGSHVQMDITRDIDPYDQRTVIAYNYNAGGGYYSWIDIDGGNGWGAWPNNPSTPGVAGHIWPYIAVANNNNIILATGDYSGNMHHLYLTTDEGISWSYIGGFDSCAILSQFVRASENPGSNKVVFVNTSFITDTIANGQLDNNVWYMLSTDGGVTWGSRINITSYQPSDSIRAYCNVNAIFDNNDDLHITWAGRKVTDNYYEASKIFHWDEVNDTITIVSSPPSPYPPGGWWIAVTGGGDYGAWRMPADQPQLIVDTNDYLYCLWHGNDDYNDFSAAGFINGEFYGAYSSDYGITWSDYVNLTNTHSPGAGPGACDDEDYMTACPKVVTDSIFITYIEDKDAGSYAHSEGVMTENPVRCWVFWTGLIRTGIEEDQASSAKFQEPILRISPNPFTTQCVVKLQTPESPAVRDPRFPDIEESDMINRDKTQMHLKIFDASGRLVNDFFLPTVYSSVPTTIKWSGTDRFDRPVPAGVYFVEFNTGDDIMSRKVIKLK